MNIQIHEDTCTIDKESLISLIEAKNILILKGSMTEESWKESAKLESAIETLRSNLDYYISI